MESEVHGLKMEQNYPLRKNWQHRGVHASFFHFFSMVVPILVNDLALLLG